MASWEKAWQQGREWLNRRDVLVVDEAGMVGGRQMERISPRRRRGAKVVLVGDAGQLQPIEAGAAFRAIAERVGYRELRRRRSWRCGSAKHPAISRAEQPERAFDRYKDSGTIHFEEKRSKAKADLIQSWAEYRAARGAEKATSSLPTPGRRHQLDRHARADTQGAHRACRPRGQGGKSRRMAAMTAPLASSAAADFAPGNRVMFLRNDRELGVKNGTLGTATEVTKDSMSVILDGKEGRAVGFNLTRLWCDRLRVCRHRAQIPGRHRRSSLRAGHAGRGRHLAYVGMTRHRDGVESTPGVTTSEASRH